MSAEDRQELQMRFANQAQTNEASIDELVAHMDEVDAMYRAVSLLTGLTRSELEELGGFSQKGGLTP